jgi:hypothetical protein
MPRNSDLQPRQVGVGHSRISGTSQFPSWTGELDHIVASEVRSLKSQDKSCGIMEVKGVIAACRLLTPLKAQFGSSPTGSLSSALWDATCWAADNCLPTPVQG